MSLSILRRFSLNSLLGLQPWIARDFSNPHFKRIPESQLVEEETQDGYLAERYYPVRIGDMLSPRYQVVGKLGWGVTSTVWLARDLTRRRHVALKVYISSSSLGMKLEHELSAYRRLEQGPLSHPGRQAVRSLLDSFTISGPHGMHQCIVHPPLWEHLYSFVLRNSIGRLPTPMLAYTLRQLLQAIDYAHQCRVIHTDIKASNIMFTVNDPSIFENFEKAELEHPIPRKEIDGRVIYLSRPLELPNLNAIGLPVLCDFGSTAWGEEEHRQDVQPDRYRAPEITLDVPWSYEIDIWNIGCLVWDLYEGENLFKGIDPEHKTYRTRAHLAEMIALLGPPPPAFIARGALKSKFFSEQNEFQAGIAIPPRVSLEQRETNLVDEDKELFLRLMGKMLQWNPKDRQTPQQLLNDEWLKRHVGG